jgi:EAL domain-containing protein (putative c-di-GMP-specific phosphodiesterase class I)
MARLKGLGLTLSLDDFGTGYSSLSYLRMLPLDQVKIDQSFVRKLAKGRYDDAIVKTIVSLARSLDLAVIAEGVETMEQRDFLERFGCRHYQGYLYGKPMAVEEFESLTAYETC